MAESSSGGGGGGGGGAAAAAEPKADGDPLVVSVRYSDVAYLTALRLWMPRDLQLADARASVALALREALASFGDEVRRCPPRCDLTPAKSTSHQSHPYGGLTRYLSI